MPKKQKTIKVTIELTEQEYQQFEVVAAHYEPLRAKALIHGFVLSSIEQGPASLSVAEAVYAQAQYGKRLVEELKAKGAPKLELVR